MSMHSGRIYRNSCLKTATDSCNKTSKRLDTLNGFSSNCSKTKDRTSTTVRRLAKLYDSIPDYCDIHHLGKEEFETTLDNLKATCQNLKTKVQSPISTLQEDTSNSSLSSFQPCKGKIRKKVRKTNGGKRKCSKCSHSCVLPCLNVLCKSSNTCTGRSKSAEVSNAPNSSDACQGKSINTFCKRKVDKRNFDEQCLVQESYSHNSAEHITNKSCKTKTGRSSCEERFLSEAPFESINIDAGREENCLLNDLCNQSCIVPCEYTKLNKSCITKSENRNSADVCREESQFEERYVDSYRKYLFNETNKNDDDQSKLQEESNAKKYADEIFYLEDNSRQTYGDVSGEGIFQKSIRPVVLEESAHKIEEECLMSHPYARSCQDSYCNTTYKSIDKSYLKNPCLLYDTNANTSNCIYSCEENILNERRFKSFKDDCKREVEAFHQTLREFEREIKRPTSTIIQETTKVNEETQTDLNNECTQKVYEPQYKTCNKTNKNVTLLSESLKKSLSLNDVHAVPPDDFADEERKRFIARLARIEKHNSKKHENTYLPTKIEGIKLETITKTSPKARPFSCSKKKKRAKSEENYKLPYSCFLPSPVHAEARPNLAATLRAQVCKEKLKQQRSNCRFSDGIKHFDWEVRKTPAWKSLSLQETHDQTLMLRLATRKAEQALQQRRYEINLELMRQRVKTAPLLLEGETVCGSNVGKLTHQCHEEGLQHICNSRGSNSKHRMRKKKSQSSFDSLCAHHKSEFLTARDVVNRSESESRLSNKLDSVRKIYARNSKSITPQPIKDKLKCKKKHKSLPIESGDELSSEDRAYL